MRLSLTNMHVRNIQQQVGSPQQQPSYYCQYHHYNCRSSSSKNIILFLFLLCRWMYQYCYTTSSSSYFDLDVSSFVTVSTVSNHYNYKSTTHLQQHLQHNENYNTHRRRHRRREYIHVPLYASSMSLIPNDPMEHDRNKLDNRMTRNNNNKGDENDIKKQQQQQQYRSQRWILFVDDEPSIRDAVGQLLIQCGYHHVTLCSNGEEALRVALYGSPPSLSLSSTQQQQPQPQNSSSALTTTTSTTSPRLMTSSTNRRVPDLIVSDVRTPGGMDGLMLLEQIRSQPQLIQIPVILLTAKSMVQDRVAGYQAGADAYLPKPFDPDELIVLIDHYIQRHETLNDVHQNAMVELQQNVQDIKFLLKEQMGIGNEETTLGSSSSSSSLVNAQPRVMATNVFLAPDERQVLNLLCQGKMNYEIANQMYLSTRRIEQLMTILFRKTNVKNRTELVRWAIATGNVKI